MMHTTSENYYASSDFASLLILNYNGPDNHIELYLPQNALRQKDIVKMFTQKVIDDLRSNLQPYNVDIALPRANVHHKVQLNRILDKMGIKSIDNANLTPVGINAATPLHFEQNTALKIDEKGTEMAAVTTIAPTGPAPENLKDISVVFNRPFMFIIRNSKTDAILMAGTIVHP